MFRLLKDMGFDFENIMIGLFILVIIFTICNIEPFHTGNILMPTPLELEEAIILIVFSIAMLLFLIGKKNISVYPF